MRRLELIAVLAVLLAGCAGIESKPANKGSGQLSSDGRLNLSIGQNYLDTGKLDKAEERIEAVLRSDPDSAEAHALRAMLYERQGETEKAGRSFERALALAPKDGAVLNAHAAWLCEHKQAEQADREFVLALADMDYQSPVIALANAGKCATSAGQLAKGEDYLRRALVFEPKDKTLLYLLAEVELQQEKIFEAQAFIQRRDALGADAKTLDLAARIEEAAGNALAAARYRQRLHDEFPEAVSTGEGTHSP